MLGSAFRLQGQREESKLPFDGNALQAQELPIHIKGQKRETKARG